MVSNFDLELELSRSIEREEEKLDPYWKTLSRSTNVESWEQQRRLIEIEEQARQIQNDIDYGQNIDRGYELEM
ncbi:MAG: hypothetical protein ACRBDI_03295 [Alphaproteobacteria bacterium]